MQGNQCVFSYSFSRLRPRFEILMNRDEKKITRLLHQPFEKLKRKRQKKNGRDNGCRVSLLAVLAICSALRTKSSIKVHFSHRNMRTASCLLFMFHINIYMRLYSSDKNVCHSHSVSCTF